MWFYTALITSVITAIIAIVGKKLVANVSASVLTWATLVLATPIIFIFVLKEGVPQLNYVFLLGVTGSVLFYTASQITGFRAMRISNLSAIWPLISLGPIFTLLIALMPPLSERPSAVATGGVFVTLAGVYVLNATKSKEGLLEPIKSLFKNKASLLMIVSVLTNGVVIVFDKLAINSTFPQNTTFTLFIENVMVIFGLLPVLYVRNKNFHQQITGNIKLFLLLGLINAVSTMLGFSAIGGGSIGLVATILKTQVLFVLLFSYIAFKDKPKFETLMGSVVMIAGVVLIKIGS
ncbi:hypothetical protein A2971_00300 [Candidatus Gottesmanbacteria bacterium RIFCSPLOWO2_01_FULL_46_21]|uniref:EamA domain-containing protein n=1 Tax=Candidatus Gottesmanbacteria bacterium RIFCSPLOWO2_01_FULL_46_21 TaxID=1798393 RepID=A0A1F6AVN1_9BACT|nr:MAG: hypothetical protein A2971_00300 [Candidatus Gottesmanbacteria bacterium RIFCSPLOWO2_01_FULL_46_21]